MRLAWAHLLAAVVYICGLYCCFAFILGFAGDGSSPSSFRYDFGAVPYGALYMMFIGPFALLLMLIYFALLQARMVALLILLVSSLVLGFAFLFHAVFVEFIAFVDRKDVPLLSNRGVALFRDWMSNGDGHLGVGIIWAGVSATLAHHLVYAALRPRVTKESHA